MLRLFAAIALPEEIGEALSFRQLDLDGARWRPVEAMHITLSFFGELREDTADDLDAELAGIASEPFAVELRGVGAFGEGEAIRAVWAGVADNPALSRLAAKCETAARRAGVKTDARAYRPHVTLAYLRRPNPADVAVWIQSHNLLRSPSFAVDRFGLFSSYRTGDGSRYRLEQEYRF